MAAKGKKTVEVDGVKVSVDLAFTRSWEFMRLSAAMARMESDDDADDTAKMAAVFDFYSGAIANLDDVVDALGGPSVEFAEVFRVASEALKAVQPKN